MQPPTKKPVNSDSLMRQSNRKKAYADREEIIGKGSIKLARSIQKVPTNSYVRGDLTAPGYEALNYAKAIRKSATKDSLAAVQGYPKALATKTPKKLVGTKIRKSTIKKK